MLTIKRAWHTGLAANDKQARAKGDGSRSAHIPKENSTPTSMSLAIFTTFENCTAFSAALCKSSIEKIFNPELFTCHNISARIVT